MRAVPVARAPRYVLELALQYRARGTDEWMDGRTVNMSRSGVLFRGEQDCSPNTILDMRIALPSELSGELQTRIVCRGYVVRKQATEAEIKPFLAARIRSYRFDRAKAP